MKPFFFQILFFISLSLFAVSCEEEQKADHPVMIVTTTGMIGDMVENIVGDHAEVISLMGPGVDPHLYKASHGDLEMLEKCDIVVYNGLHLEGKMGELFEKFGTQKPVIAISGGLQQKDLRKAKEFTGSVDPHIWFDVSLWNECSVFLSDTLAGLMPEAAESIRKNQQKFSSELKDLHAFAADKVAEIPEQQRVLVTAHDAFGYFGRAYGIKVKGLQGISTMSEFGLRDITNLVDFIVDNKIPAVFVESSVPRKSLEAVVEGCRSRGHNVKIGGTLYSDAMGDKGTPEGTYTGMVRYNVRTITEALKP